MNRFYNPVKTLQGRGAVKGLSSFIQELKAKKALLLVWNECVCENADLKAAVAESRETEFKTLVFDRSNPDTGDLYNLYTSTKDEGFDLVIAVGGGSVMDMAKSLCCLYGNELSSEEEVRSGIKEKRFTAPTAKWIGVPTTAGTGSEVTCWATVWNTVEKGKLSLESHNNYAYGALVDPQFASTMPPSLAVSSALDAAAHATEAYWAKASNLVSRTYALKAISIIMDNIEDLFDKEKNAQAHDYMAQGSLLAGLAFSNTKTTACHSLSYPLTLKYGIPHGVAVSMLIAPVMAVNMAAVEDMRPLFAAYGVASVEALEEKINGILDLAGIPHGISRWGAERGDFPLLSMSCKTKGRIDNNPVDLTEETIVKILNSIF